MKLAVVIPAAGFSSRYLAAEGAGDTPPRSKLDEQLGGRPVLHRTVELFTNYASPDHDIVSITVAGPHDPGAFADFKVRHGDKLGLLGVTLCQGGRAHRYETVAAALEHVPDGATHIAVHDAARPCTPTELLDRLFDAAARRDAVVPAIEVTDSVKRVSGEAVEDAEPDPLASILGDEAGGKPKLRRVEDTIDRTGLVAVQTPQVFRAEVLLDAYAQPNLSSPDDAALVERLGKRVYVVEGDARNIKITRPVDLRLAHAILGVAPARGRPTHKKF